ncbi:ABC transporter ATP-binding protein [Jiangella sp. DSM 45060]|uniref:ABC transporter ATP-binding protein n=1 Tax=Jiangella sp. DSM 45060 TaxID=1798224 RepID=UPI00087BC6CE|nr:oligopeptide/dipeptide ABC transporter ATP-binding protein [Jiangella sp. DSM 45060]SDT21103.1 oligopeptide transport system ATP-binding protein [Jiangella sp. DSM 45060]
MSGNDPLLAVDGLVKHFPVRGGVLQRQVATVRAVDGVSFEIGRGETLALVGESGCGKSTVGKTIMRFHPPTAGTVRFDGRDLAAMKARELRAVRRDIQFVFQDPFASLPARMPVGDILAEPLEIHGVGDRRSRRARVVELLELVGLGADSVNRYPHEFSGGQRQRVGIARALALEPRLLILDEPVSALDVSIQAQVINLLARLQRQLGVAYLFIAHDLAVVQHLAHRVAVMYLGHIVEYGEAGTVFTRPAHPYTQALLSAVPVPDPRLRDLDRRILLSGDLPSPADPPAGCPFHTRCWKAEDRCRAERPVLEIRTPGGAGTACHFAAEAELTSGPAGRTAT